MSAIDDLIKQIDNPALRERLKLEWKKAVKDKKFGLVFEQHLPELLPLYQTRPRRGDLVCKKGGALTELWQVRRIRDGMASCGKILQNPETATKQPNESVLLPVDELIVVRQFGEPIYPALTPIDEVQNGPLDAPWHTLIEADNYHALQLLEYLYAGQVDCIYIDPPYNTGAKDWKYNNDYVDGNDSWRHSKWLAFMERRLKLAKKLLKPDIGVLIVTIDKNELHHLGVLLAELLPNAIRQLVTICINPSGTSGEGLSRVEEYAFFCFLGIAEPSPVADDLLLPSTEKRSKGIRWESIMRGGTAWYRKSRCNLCYPVVLDPTGVKIVDVGEPLPFHDDESIDNQVESNRPFLRGDSPLAWPLRSDGRLGIWRIENKKLLDLVSKGYAYVSSHDKERGTWTIRYLMEGTVNEIDSGVIAVEGRGHKGEVVLKRLENRQIIAKTIWNRGRHTAGGGGGSTLLVEILGKRDVFSFPKSVYSTKDCIDVVIGNRPNALILDFFAGSGTTLNAVNLLNAADGGQRRCILVTNNEVSAEEAENLRARGLQPGAAEWEALGICRSVTWPRSKYTILGQRDDGTQLTGEYLTGKTVEKAKPRKFKQIGFVDPAVLNTAAKKQLVALIDGLPQTLVKEPCPFIVSEEHKASILFEPEAAEDWLAALEEQDHVSDFYLVTSSKKQFDSLKEQVNDLLGPLLMTEDEKRPMAQGFAANLAYFKLDFLDKDRVTLKRAFREILPLLWLQSGAVGPRPTLANNAPEPAMLIPAANRFAVLLNEAQFNAFVEQLTGRSGLSHIFLVTDADESFKDMAQAITEAICPANPGLQTIQLYRDYLHNFTINRQLAENQAVTREQE